ncbi:PTS sugar transporter subunit IIB [Collinsella tanakaei]|uniref:PTS sugar transporter subunit IIB n=1 Tax=Collinsella tanakaei TaxID=626935 RepID=UPI00195B233F|nr:PTS sugar transporter subunit IIB [Collinsella tanakaei]MBM6779167.1 PTS sugar transporter subunit IIB [Collinsella tanakaei]MDM8246727.1 PTS sugar transporter subunit IIB [Collinsella tanakaei]MEE0476222.1 PTS sugar transporter subunit IIB [Collinsella stercoris]
MADKKKIYLFCSAGMSTSMLAQNMQQVGDSHNLPVEVRAFPIGKVDEIAGSEHPACVLLGPQVHHQYEETKKRIESTFDIPVGILDQQAYGMMDGEASLKYAVKLIKTYKK